MPLKDAFETYLYSKNLEGSKKARSYLTALKHLQTMLRSEAYGFDDCIDLWSVESVERLAELREQVLAEAKLGTDTPWYLAGSSSYLSNGYCSAALTQLIEFLPQHQHAGKALDLLHAHHGDEVSLAKQLNQLDPEVPSGTVHDPSSKDGKDRLRATKTRIGQHAFREVILDIYQNRCCLTGLDLPTLNRASHIIGWAERKDTRMDPRNGLCLSATYPSTWRSRAVLGVALSVNDLSR